MKLPVTLRLSSIYCRDEADGIGNAEPYLWTIFFKLDGEDIKQTNLVSLTGQATFHFSPGSHENLRTHAVDPGESVKIPESIGKWSADLVPILIKDTKDNIYQIPGMIGVAAILLEEDNVSDSGAESGHKALNKYVQDSINDFIAGINLADFANEANPKAKLDELTKALTDTIKKESSSIVEGAIKNKQGFFSNIWSWVNSDDKIGAEIWIFDQDEIVRNGYHKSFSIRWKNEGDWELFGEAHAPNPCQAQLTAVNQKKQQISGIEKNIRSLQTQMAQAPAAQKPFFRAEIDEAKQLLPPLEAELKQLQELLKACYLRQNMRTEIVGDLSHVLDHTFITR